MNKDFVDILHRAIAVAGVLGVLGCQTPTPLPWPVPEDVRTLEVNGYPMAYRETGQGPTVVMVHGVWSDYRAFGTAQRALADRFRVVSVSLRHAYPQDWDGSGSTYSAAQHAADLAAFIETLGSPVHLVGQSYGAHVAMAVALARPDRVARLVLAEGGEVTGGHDAAGTPSAPVAQAEQFLKLGQQTAQLYRSRGIEAGLEFAVDALSGPGTWQRYPPAVKDVHRHNAWSIVALARHPPAPVSCRQFGALKMPVLLLTGENTSPRHKALVRTQAQCLPTAGTATIPNAGHVVQLNAPAFEAALRQFLQ